jgi:general secretion pathway protein C
MAIQTIVRRGFHYIVLTLVGVAACLQARGIGQLVIAALTRVPPSNGGVRTARYVAPSAPPKNSDPIFERNPFDSMPGPPTRFDAELDPLAWPDCKDVRVVIVTESNDPSWSLASVQGPGDARPHLRRVGDGVADKQVAFIGYNQRQQTPAVWMAGRGALCQASLFRSQPPPEPQAVELNVDRSVIQRPLPAQAALTSSVRVVPEQLNGKVIGIRLFGIRPATLLGSLGLQNGDRLETINGFDITDPEKALQAYARLRTATHLRVHVNRRGSPVDIDLNII